MKKRTQISQELYGLMKDYIEDHYDADDSVRYCKILKGIEKKEMASLRRGLYSEYKVNGNEEARKAYLELTGQSGFQLVDLEGAGIPGPYIAPDIHAVIWQLIEKPCPSCRMKDRVFCIITMPLKYNLGCHTCMHALLFFRNMH